MQALSGTTINGSSSKKNNKCIEINSRKIPYAKNKKVPKGLGCLAEAIMLQSMEDIWKPDLKEESLNFFNGEGFIICAEIAGIDRVKQHKIRQMLPQSGRKNTWRESCR